MNFIDKIINQTGGYNICDESNPEYMLPKIIKILEELETDNEFDFEAYNKISETFYKCYDVLIDEFYAKNEIYYQTINGVRGDRPIYKLHINYSSLIFLSFLVELHCFLLTHVKIEINVDGNNFIEKKPIEINTIRQPLKNQLERPFYKLPEYPERYFVYKNTLPRNITNKKGIIECLNIFCRELTLLRNNIFTVLVGRLFKQLNLMITPDQRFTDLEYLKNIIFNNGNYESVFEDWREKLILHVSTFANAGQSYQQILKEIYDCITYVLYQFSTERQLNNAKFIYDPDVNGFFEWVFLDLITRPLEKKTGFNLGSCITSTLLEHYILNLLHFKNNSVNIVAQYNFQEKNGNISFKRHDFWQITNRVCENTLSKMIVPNIHNPNNQYFGITHFGTRIINDIKKFYGDIINVHPKDLRVSEQDKSISYKPFSIVDEKILYFNLFAFNSIDANIAYIYKNMDNGRLERSHNPRLILTKLQEISEYLMKKMDKLNNEEQGYISKIPKLQYTQEQYQDVDLLIKSCINKNIVFPSIINNDIINERIRISIEDDDVITGPKEVFKTIMTDFVTNEFYKSNQNTLNFFKLITNVLNSGIKKYIELKNLPEDSINFIFKGGNALRIIIDSFLSQIPKNALRPIEKIIKDNFKKSDADFQINIKNLIGLEPRFTQEFMDEIYNDVTLISYILLYRIRNIIVNDVTKYIDYFNYDTKWKKDFFEEKLLLKFNQLIQRGDTQPPYGPNTQFVNISFDDVVLKTNEELKLEYVNFQPNNRDQFLTEKNYKTRKDFIIEKDGNELVLTELPYISSLHKEIFNQTIEYETDMNIYRHVPSTNFYISVNKSIDGFNLTRLKVNFGAELLDSNTNTRTVVSIPGEYIDISIPEYTHTQQYFNNNLQNYEIIQDGEPIYSFMSFKLGFFAEDLILILFINADLPWSDNKYAKRLTRFLVILYINLLQINVKNHIKNQFLKQLNKYFNISVRDGVIRQAQYYKDIFDQLVTNNFVEYPEIINSLFYKCLYKVLFSNPTISPEYQIINSDGNLVLGLHYKLEDPAKQNFDELTQFYRRISTLIYTFSRSMNQIINYKNSNVNIENTNILDSIVGNQYLRKYLKYKQKYLELKKISNKNEYEP